ncbi:FtsK/SpoIIIE family DNA translocase [Lacticaseibacillus daqingensis]|uniref:FtsK/SpoIIIE family DNA translocase n=1 Tax=Lacticaseibacillus daqingensis TaxID=2486014 RepID=UPI000F76BD21|nr:DNA translocase FtsK [Lacticaseibacillus daqingensis]
MATRRKTTKKRPATKRKKAGDHTINWVGVAFLGVAGLAFFKLGIIGTFLANCLRLGMGNAFQVGAAALATLGAWCLLSGALPPVTRRLWGGGALIALGSLNVLTATTMHVLAVHSHFLLTTWRLLKSDFARGTAASDVGGGLIGGAVYNVFAPLVSEVGAVVLGVLMGLIGFGLIVGITPAQVFAACRWVGTGVGNGVTWAQTRLAALKQAHAQKAPTSAKSKPAAADTEPPAQAAPEDKPLPTPLPQDEFEIHAPAQPSVAPKPLEPTADATAPVPSVEPVEDATEAFDADATATDYQLPSLDLLSAVPPADQSQEVEKIKQNRVKLKQTLESFGVNVTVKSATLGPSITQYEIQPAVGVKVAKIVNLADDLALALAAKDIRIEAPIPGKPLIGIEVPNATIATVGYREVLANTPAHPGKPLVIPLGKDVSGHVLTFDLTKMPHLLIAGATGSGKSVMINVIITSILMTAKPSEVRLMLIDPKRVELSVYNGVPHLLTPVVTEAKKAPSALNKVLAEMDKRYQAFSDNGVRNMTEFNQKAQTADNLTRMPYIVVIVDELSDLMMVAGNEVETAIVRLAQMARAAGIHIIIATQRPSVDVITGLIKANVPSRIAFAVSSGVDSRTILDTNGAETLLGRGDMLYDPIDASKPVRIQGAFIPSADVEAVVAAITAQVDPAYEEDMAPSDTVEADANADSEDELYEEARTFVIQQGSASTSMLQRRFRIGYNRAARLIDDLEANQVVGPSDGSRPRKVFAQPDPEQP